MWITFELGQKISLRKISINKFHLSTHGPPHMASPPTVLKKSGSLGKRENAKESSVFSLKQRQHPVWWKHCCAYQVRQKVKVKVAQSCLTLRGLYSLWNSPGQNTGVGSCSLLQRIFPTQGSNPGLPHFRWILCQLSHQGSPRILQWVTSLFFLEGHPDPGIKLGSPTLQVDSLLAELQGSPCRKMTVDNSWVCKLWL